MFIDKIVLKSVEFVTVFTKSSNYMMSDLDRHNCAHLIGHRSPAEGHTCRPRVCSDRFHTGTRLVRTTNSLQTHRKIWRQQMCVGCVGSCFGEQLSMVIITWPQIDKQNYYEVSVLLTAIVFVRRVVTIDVWITSPRDRYTAAVAALELRRAACTATAAAAARLHCRAHWLHYVCMYLHVHAHVSVTWRIYLWYYNLLANIS